MRTTWLITWRREVVDVMWVVVMMYLVRGPVIMVVVPLVLALDPGTK